MLHGGKGFATRDLCISGQLARDPFGRDSDCDLLLRVLARHERRTFRTLFTRRPLTERVLTVRRQPVRQPDDPH